MPRQTAKKTAPEEVGSLILAMKSCKGELEMSTYGFNNHLWETSAECWHMAMFNFYSKRVEINMTVYIHIISENVTIPIEAIIISNLAGQRSKHAKNVAK